MSRDFVPPEPHQWPVVDLLDGPALLLVAKGFYYLMANEAKAIAVANREDISHFAVHLTRKTSPDHSAKSNFVDIWNGRKIKAGGIHCLHKKGISGFSNEKQKLFKVSCFTEIPLNQLHLLVGEILGRRIELEPYGFVFSKELLIEKGAQPAIYINNYGENTFLRKSVDRLYDIAKPNVGNGLLWRMLPFINVMHDGHDFSWEREWRILGDLAFEANDVVCLIMPEGADEKNRKVMAKNGIAVISPGWRYEQIVAELAKQQRATKRKWVKLLAEKKETATKPPKTAAEDD
jgi:hypothetical protein